MIFALDQDPSFKPQIKSGWGLGGAGKGESGGNQQSYLGMQRKNQAA
jgi:hypothetical protein